MLLVLLAVVKHNSAGAMEERFDADGYSVVLLSAARAKSGTCDPQCLGTAEAKHGVNVATENFLSTYKGARSIWRCMQVALRIEGLDAWKIIGVLENMGIDVVWAGAGACTERVRWSPHKGLQSLNPNP